MKTSIHPTTFLDAKISVFKNVKSKKPYKKTNFRDWLFNNNRDLRSKIEKIRDEYDKEKRKALKESMECITGSGVFENGRTDLAPKTHNGYLVIDIDHHHNLDLGSKFFTLIEDVFSKISVVNYAGRSIGGSGYFLIIGISNPEKHTAHFNHIKNYLKKSYDINVDESCINVSRLRLKSYDENYYMNEKADLLRKYDVPMQVKRKPINYDSNSTDEIEDLVRKIEKSGISIARSYNEYLNIGIVFYTECGESGREYYHRVCRTDPKYEVGHCDKEFDKIISYGYNNVTLGTLIHKMKEYGVI
mgnify:CR=1 FL=1